MHDPKEQVAIPLDYATPPPPVRRPKFCFGAVSLVLSGIAAVLSMTVAAAYAAELVNWRQHDFVLGVMGCTAMVGIGFGIVGLFQRSGRQQAVWGITLAIIDLALVPSLMFG